MKEAAVRAGVSPATLRRWASAAAATGLEPALIERFWTGMGLPTAGLERLTEDDVQALRYAASVLAAGFPLVAFLQLSRVYGQALAQVKLKGFDDPVQLCRAAMPA